MSTTTMDGRREHVLAEADRLARIFAERAAEHDRDATFPHDNYADLAAAGVLRMSVPEELGGFGAGLPEVAAVLERVAAGDGATALSLAMHVSPLGQWASVWRRTGDDRLAGLLRRAAEGGLVWASLTAERGMANRMTDAATVAEPTDGGYLLTGRKIFATNSAIATDFSTTARDPHAEGGPRLLLCTVSMDAPGIRVHPTWDTLGMRATRSDDLELDSVFVPSSAVVHSLPAGHLDRRVMETVWAWAMPAFASVYTGIAAGALQWTIDRLTPAGRAGDPVVQDVIGECHILLESSRALIHRHVEEVVTRALHARGVQEAVARCVTVKHAAANNAVAILQKLVDVNGGAAFGRALPFERMWRDVQAGPIMPMGNVAARQFVGATALGVEVAPVAT
ncbi:MAG TPA: acyl-CoA dehydrogenase family protein [Pseudonocardia sp.]|nr:acyl-CoA dehydrogenase family protein [Pseudonocardia sp.]